MHVGKQYLNGLQLYVQSQVYLAFFVIFTLRGNLLYICRSNNHQIDALTLTHKTKLSPKSHAYRVSFNP